MKPTTVSLSSFILCTFLAFEAQASLIVNIDVPDGRGDGDAGVPTVTDFMTQNPGAGLTLSSTFFNSTGAGNASNFGNNFATPQTIGGFTVEAGNNGGVIGGDSGGNATNSGFNAGDDSHNDLNPITEGYAFNAQDSFVTIGNLLAHSSAGDTIVLSTWGIGDNSGQDATFTVTYGSNTAAEGNIQSTLYNSPGQPRDSDVGSVPFVNFTFLADGVTDEIRFDISPNTGSNTTINAFTLAVVPVPEPSSLLLSVLGASFLFRRKR